MSTPIENNTEELRNILQQVNELPNAGNTPVEAVLYVEQTLTEEQKAQARKNIGIGSGGNVDVTIDGETLVIAENSTATIENETLIL